MGKLNKLADRLVTIGVAVVLLGFLKGLTLYERMRSDDAFAP